MLVGLEEQVKGKKMLQDNLNIRGYYFSKLDHLEDHRRLLADIGELLAVKGTVILSEEGINLSIVGKRSDSEQMFEACKSIPGLEKLSPKKDWSNNNPYEKLKIKIKDEIIKMNKPGIRPELKRASSVDSKTFSRWLIQGCDDSGLPIKIFDTRNHFEIEMGRFAKCLDFGLKRFSDFPNIFDKNKSKLEGHRVITVCTGGIRCEKATLYMNQNGIPNAVQLEGGILEYIQSTDGKFWSGECFEFKNQNLYEEDLTLGV